MAESRAPTRLPLAHEPHRNWVEEDLAGRLFCHAHYTYVLQTLWRGLSPQRPGAFLPVELSGPGCYHAPALLLALIHGSA